MRLGRLAGVAAVAVLATACGADRDDSLSAAVDSSAGASAPADGGACTPVAGYTLPITDKGFAAADGDAIAIDAGDFFFGPTCVGAVDGQTLTLHVTNSGAILHNVTITDQGIDVDVPVGETVEIAVKVGHAPLVYVCKFHRTAGMVGAVLPEGN